MFERILKIFRTQHPTPLGRWSVKTCDELKTAFNSVYQNRDHCGDIICKTPKKADEYHNTDLDVKDRSRK
jgi:hypothetical protein